MVDLTPARRDDLNRASELGMKVEADRGVLIMEVAQNSPAARSGLRKGDVILAINGQPVKASNDVQQVVEVSTIGRDLAIEINRAGRKSILSVKPGAYPVSER